MIVAKFEVSGVRVNMVYRDVVPAGIIGADIEISYTDDIWRDLRKTVVFRGAVTKDVVTDESIVTIPPEVVEAPNTALSVGVYGVDANGKLAVPTLWADLGYIRPATDPSGDTTTAPSLPVWAQIKQIADDAKQQAQSVRDDADTGRFDGAQGAPGADGKTPEYGVDYGTPEQICEIAQSAAEILQPEVDQIKSDLGVMQDTTMIVTKSTNLYDESKATDGYRIAGGGSVVTQDGSVLSDFIEIPDGMTYAVPCAYFNNGYRIFSYSNGFYDSDKNRISGNGGAVTSGIQIPSGAKYFRASWLKDTTSQRFINFNTDGSLFPYEEYYEPIFEVKTSKEVVEKLDNYESRISALENPTEIPVDRVICWGDSLTDGAGASDTAHQYPFVLKSLINDNNNGIVTDSAGQGGEGTYSIATRQGGVVVNVKPCTIPSSGSVNIKIEKWNGLTISLCRRGGSNVTADNAKMKINPCYIAGVKGTLLRDNDGKYVFTRAEVGEEVTFTRPMPLLTYAHENYNGENEVAIIWSGTNDIAENGGTIEKTIQGINMMIARLKSNKYIVVGLTSKAYHSDIDDKNFRLATEFKERFVNVRDYILAYGLEDSGITATEQDLTDIENGEIPTSLRVDDVHGNDYFYDIVAKLVYKKGKELGYWN